MCVPISVSIMNRNKYSLILDFLNNKKDLIKLGCFPYQGRITILSFSSTLVIAIV